MGLNLAPGSNRIRRESEAVDSTLPRGRRKKDWDLSEEAFGRLLAWLDEGTDSGGERYLEIRRRLVLYFDRKNCLSPDELADETLNRVARRLEEERAIITDAPAHYCYIVARFVLLEALRKGQREESFNERACAGAVHDATEEEKEQQRRVECLDRCAGELELENRELIIGYYRGKGRLKIENRRAMAARLGISMNALSIRASRIRDKLEACVRKCLSGG
jgi:DNA-directed RNA polymerase specialized sigma24 family protein